jgi:anthranilate synthase/aminodeoxychorismate synthase-like glutamine amidotransferase
VIVVVDNYDSFTYNLVQLIGSMGHELKVLRNDAFSLDDLENLQPTHLVISPGPGRPQQAGQSIATVEHFARRIPVLGVCLGHQAIAAAAGGRIDAAERLMHGKASSVYHDGRGLFRGLPNPFSAGRYHSLVVPEEDLPEELEVAAHTADGEIMGLRWRDSLAVGVQFHPESVLTPKGNTLIRNFLEAPRRPC